jgi:hypothetical protein
VDQTKTDFIGITESKNVQVLEYNASEKGSLRLLITERYYFADYRLGIRFIMGTNLLPAIKSIRNSKVWSNNVPVFGPEFCSNDDSGLLKLLSQALKYASWKTNITAIEGATKVLSYKNQRKYTD